MINKTYFNNGVCLAALFTSLTVLTLADSEPLIAATFQGDFTVDIVSGGLEGDRLSGSFEFDDSVLTGVGFESIGNNRGEFSFEFEWFGETFRENSNPGFASRAEFSDGDFLGVRYFLGFNRSTPNFSLSLNRFTYEGDTGVLNSAGVVSYGDLRRVPEPLNLFGPLATFVMGGLLLNRRNKMAA